MKYRKKLIEVASLRSDQRRVGEGEVDSTWASVDAAPVVGKTAPSGPSRAVRLTCR